MCKEYTAPSTLRDWLRDPMIRLVMESDGVTEREMVDLVRRVCVAVSSRPESVVPPPARWRTVERHSAW